MADETKKTNRLLLTGANGFLGSEIVRQCVKFSRSVRCVGRQTRPDLADYYQVDLSTDPIPDAIFSGIDAVIHAAGLAHQFGRSATNEDAFDRINAVAVQRTIEAAANNGVAHFVLISSSGVYGPSASFPAEDSPCKPEGLYAISKRAGEEAAIAIARKTGIRLTIARLTTLYGANDCGNLSRLIRAIDRKRFIQIGAGSNRKNLLHKVDAASACLKLADADAGAIEIYNVGIDPVTIRQVVDEIVSALPTQRVPKIPAFLATIAAATLSALCLGKGPAARIHDSIKKWLRSDEFDTVKFREAFSFKPQMSLSAGIKDQVEFYRKDSQGSLAMRRHSSLAKRIFDVLLSVLLLAVFSIPMIVIALLVRLTSAGPALYWSQRVGQNNKLFPMAKFRSMRTTAPEVATHLLGDSSNWITPLGKALRKTSLDELPQLLNILQGHMSFVGPRPALHNQNDLIELRTALDVHVLRPGITGLAQVSGRDELLICEKVEFDRQYLHKRSLLIDLRLIFKTALNVLLKRGVKQADEESALQSVTVKQGTDVCCFATPSVLSAVAVAMSGYPKVKVICWRASTQPDTQQIAFLGKGMNKICFVTRSNDTTSWTGANFEKQNTENRYNFFRLPELASSEVGIQLQLDLEQVRNHFRD